LEPHPVISVTSEYSKLTTTTTTTTKVQENAILKYAEHPVKYRKC
jgi:hypothetical protein